MTIFSEGLHEVLPILRQFSPVLGAIIGGVPGIAASSALSLLNKAFVPGSNTSNIPGLVAAISSDPDVETKLTDLENTHREWLLEALNLNKLKKAQISINLEWE